jgi:hypothetical protein
MPRPHNPILDPIWGISPFSGDTMKAVEDLGDPPLPIYKGPGGRLVDYEDNDPSHKYAYNQNPTRCPEWHRWILLELTYGFWIEGRWNEPECAEGFAWALYNDAAGVVRLWDCVRRDVELGRLWDSKPDQAPGWWKTKGVDPKYDPNDPSNLPGHSYFSKKALDEQFPSMKGIGKKWDSVALETPEFRCRTILGTAPDEKGNALKVTHSRRTSAQKAWLDGFKKTFSMWLQQREITIAGIRKRYGN